MKLARPLAPLCAATILIATPVAAAGPRPLVVVEAGRTVTAEELTRLAASNETTLLDGPVLGLPTTPATGADPVAWSRRLEAALDELYDGDAGLARRELLAVGDALDAQPELLARFSELRRVAFHAHLAVAALDGERASRAQERAAAAGLRYPELAVDPQKFPPWLATAIAAARATGAGLVERTLVLPPGCAVAIDGAPSAIGGAVVGLVPGPHVAVTTCGAVVGPARRFVAEGGGPLQPLALRALRLEEGGDRLRISAPAGTSREALTSDGVELMRAATLSEVLLLVVGAERTQLIRLAAEAPDEPRFELLVEARPEPPAAAGSSSLAIGLTIGGLAVALGGASFALLAPPPSASAPWAIGATLLGAGLALTGGTLLVLPLFALKPDAAGPGGLAGAGVGFATEL